jgi:hypothetical protein
LRRQSCEGIRKRRGPIDDCMGTIAAFFDCRVWCETSEDATLRYIFFGLPVDVQAAVYLHDLIALAFATETAVLQAGEIYRSTHSSRRRSAHQLVSGWSGAGIIRKLDTLRQARDVAGGSTNGRALVPSHSYPAPPIGSSTRFVHSVRPPGKMVPAVWIEHTTYRLQASSRSPPGTPSGLS